MTSSSHSTAHAGHRGDGQLASVRDEISELKDAIHNGAHDAAGHGRRVVRAAGSAVHDAATGVRESALRTHERVSKTISDRPYTSVAVAVGAGAMLMALAMMWRRKT